MLIVLLRNPHRLITKDELLDAVWRDCAVSENSLTRSIALLRRLLGDDTHEPRYIATVPTVGYRFLCDVESAEDGMGALGSTELHRPENGRRFEAPGGTHHVEGSTQTLHVQAAVAAQVPENIKQPANQGRRLLVPGLIAAALVILVTGFLIYRAIRSRDAPGHTAQSASAATASSRMGIVPLTNLPGWGSGSGFLARWGEDCIYLEWRKSDHG